MQSPKSFLVIQPWGVGDFLMTLPACHSLKNSQYTTSIDLIVSSQQCLQIAEASRLFRSVQVIERKPVPFLKAISKKAYDAIALASEVSLSYIPLVKLIHPFVPFASHSYRPNFLSCLSTISFNPHEHRVWANWNIFKHLFPNIKSPEPYTLPIPESEITKASSWINEHSLNNFNWIAIHPGSGMHQSSKRIPLSILDTLIHTLRANNPSLRIGVVIGPEETELRSHFKDLSAKMSSEVFFIESLSILTVCSILSTAKLVIAGDTGIGHLGSVSGTSVLTIGGVTDLQRTHPYTAKGEIIAGSSVYKNLLSEKIFPSKRSSLEIDEKTLITEVSQLIMQ